MAGHSFFDRLRDSIGQIVSGGEKEEEAASDRQRKNTSQNEIEAAIIVLATGLMRLRGNHTNDTEKVLLDFLEKNFGKASTAKRRKQINDHLFTGPQPYTRIACEQLKAQATYTSRLEAIRLLYELATLDGSLSPGENNLINKIARYLAITTDELKTIKEKYSRIGDPFVILEIAETSSIAIVKSAYRKMALKYHPDKNKDKTDREEANRKFREIKRAYEAIVKRIEGGL